MRKILGFGVVCAMFALTLFAAMSEEELQKRMKAAGDHMGGLRKAMQAGSMADVATHGQAIHDALKGSDEFWAAHKADKAVAWTKDGVEAAAALVAAAKANNAADAKAASGKIGASCKGCHEAHREKIGENQYKITW
jgi:cytochrome c556